jgi:hypothetical protein
MLMWSPEYLQTLFLALNVLENMPQEARREPEIHKNANAPPARVRRLRDFCRSRRPKREA